MSKLIFLGPPGSGKGTQAKVVSKKLAVEHLSTGDILRAEVKKGSDLGNKAKEYMHAGKLVPDDLILGMVKSKLASPELKKGFIFDGFPRTVPQAEGLDKLTAEMGINIDHVVNINVKDEELVKRLTARSFCPECGRIYNDLFSPPKQSGVCDDDGSRLSKRDDDKEEVVRNRLDIYHKETEPLEDYYRSKSALVDIAGSGSVEEITDRIMKEVSG